MQLDRSRFLLLTSALAAATAVSFTAGLGGCSKSDSATDAGAASDASTADTSVADGGVDAADASTADATACLGDDGVGPNCDPNTDGGAKCSIACYSIASKLKHQVAVNAAECIDNHMDVAPTCEGGNAPCILAAFALACDDATADPYCAGVVASCADAGADGGAVTQSECVAVAKGLSAAGRTSLTTCLGNFDCDICFDQIKSAF